VYSQVWSGGAREGLGLATPAEQIWPGGRQNPTSSVPVTSMRDAGANQCYREE
jgi:hypothetical protein